MVTLILAVVSLLFALSAWWTSGVMRWENLIGPVGLILLVLAMFVGPQRQLPYYGLLGTSVALCALSVWVRLTR